MNEVMTSGLLLTVFAVWLAVLLLLVRRGGGLGPAILTAAFGLGISLGRGLQLPADAWAVTMDPQVSELLAVIILIAVFSQLLKDTRRMQGVSDFLIRVLKYPRWVLVAVPALVGLIPMPGGAMFTAPITEEVGNTIRLKPADKVFSNYWFRHCWELAFPLYPGIILAAGLMKISPAELAWRLMPLAFAALASGVVVFFRVAESRPVSEIVETPAKSDEKSTWLVLWPILAVVGLAIARVPLIPGLVGVIVLYAWAERISVSQLRAILRESIQWPIVLLVWAVFFFGRELQVTGVLSALSEVMIAHGLSLAFLSCSLPFALGLLTGVTTGFVGTVFPLLLPLWGKDALDWVPFAYACGLAGVFLTPAHLCLSMTQEYFQAPWKPILARLALPVAVVVALGFWQIF